MLLLYAWTAAGVFVLALTYVGYFFVTLTPQPTHEPPIVALELNLLLFGAFAAHHSLMARTVPPPGDRTCDIRLDSERTADRYLRPLARSTWYRIY